MVKETIYSVNGLIARDQILVGDPEQRIFRLRSGQRTLQETSFLSSDIYTIMDLLLSRYPRPVSYAEVPKLTVLSALPHLRQLGIDCAALFEEEAVILLYYRPHSTASH